MGIKLDSAFVDMLTERAASPERRLAAAVVLQWARDLLTRKPARGREWAEVVSWPESEMALFWVERVLGLDIRIVKEFRDRVVAEKRRAWQKRAKKSAPRVIQVHRATGSALWPHP